MSSNVTSFRPGEEKVSAVITYMADRRYPAKDKDKNEIPGEFIWKYTVTIDGTQYLWWASQEEHEFIVKLGAKKGEEIILFQVPKKNPKTNRYYSVNCVEYKGFTFERGQKVEEVLGGHNDAPAKNNTAEQQSGNSTEAKPERRVVTEHPDADSVGLMVECFEKAAQVFATEKVSNIFAYFGQSVNGEDLRRAAISFYVGKERQGILGPENTDNRIENLVMISSSGDEPEMEEGNE